MTDFCNKPSVCISVMVSIRIWLLSGRDYTAHFCIGSICSLRAEVQSKNGRAMRRALFCQNKIPPPPYPPPPRVFCPVIIVVTSFRQRPAVQGFLSLVELPFDRCHPKLRRWRKVGAVLWMEVEDEDPA